MTKRIQHIPTILLRCLLVVVMMVCGVGGAAGAEVLLDKSFVTQTSTTDIPDGWTGYTYNGGSTPYFTFGTNGAVVNQPWKRLALDHGITLTNTEKYTITVETYANTANHNCIFYLSSMGNSICMGSTYGSQVQVGKIDTYASSRLVSFQSTTTSVLPTTLQTCSTVDVSKPLTYKLILKGNSLTGTVTDGTKTDNINVTIADTYSFEKIGMQLDGANGTVGVKSIKVVKVEEGDFLSGDYIAIQSAWETDRFLDSPSGNSNILANTDRFSPSVIFSLLSVPGTRGPVGTFWINSVQYPDLWIGMPTSTSDNINMVTTEVKDRITNGNKKSGWAGMYEISAISALEAGSYRLEDKNENNKNTAKYNLTLKDDKKHVTGNTNIVDATKWYVHKVTPYDVTISTNAPTGKVTYNGANLYGAAQEQEDGGKYYFSATPSTGDFEPANVSGMAATVSISGTTITVTYEEVHDPPTSITAEGFTLGVNQNATVSYTLAPLPCWDKVTFASSNPTVANVDANTGVVRGVSEGTATITLSAHEYGTDNVILTTTVEIKVVNMLVIYLNSRGTIADGGDSEDNTGNTTFGLAAGTVCGTHTVGRGDDANDGMSPEYPVATWRRAYELLADEDHGGTWDNQVIVVMGYVDNTYFSVGDRLGSLSGANPKTMTVANKPVHITGKWDGVNYQGAIGRCPASAANEYYSGLPVNADTKFSHLQLYNAKTEVKCYFVFYAHYHNLYLGEGLIMNKMPVGDVSTLGGTADCITTNAHIFGGYFDLQYIPSDHSAYVNKNTQDRKDINTKPDGFTITIKSGYWGVVSVGGRSGQTLISGSPEAPLKGRIVIDIDHENSNTAANAKNAVNGNKPCNYDIGCVLAGNHGGTMYADSEIDIYEGTISRVVNGTLGQVFGENGTSSGFHKTSGGIETATPFDSFFGRAVVNVSPRNNDNSKVKITEFYCGGLGRQTGNGPNSETQTNFYGHSIVNINGGTFENALFGAGAGGTNGIGLLSNWNTTTFKTTADGTPLHCKDKLLPYWVTEVGNVNDRNVLYGPDNDNLVDITVKNFADDGTYTTETFNIRDTKTTVTINGGIFGTAAKRASLYAGGWGEVNKALINYESQTPSTLAGDIFGGTADGLCSELIINGGTIYGDIYGAGKGSTTYYDYYNSLASKKSPGNNHAASEYLHLGTIVGNTRVFVGGNTIVNGSVFGGGDGGQLVGNSNVEIGGTAEVTGNLYGGGNMAEVSGTTKVQVGDECITE